MSTIVDPTNETGYFVVEDVPLLCYGWGIFDDCTVVLNPNQLRSGSYLVAHRQGRVPQPMVVDEQTIKWRLLIAGDRDENGDWYTSAVRGYLSNLATLRSVLDPPDPLEAPDGCRETRYHAPDGRVYVERVQWELDVTAQLRTGSAMTTGGRGALKRAVLTMRLPNGLFETLATS